MHLTMTCYSLQYAKENIERQQKIIETAKEAIAIFNAAVRHDNTVFWNALIDYFVLNTSATLHQQWCC